MKFLKKYNYKLTKLKELYYKNNDYSKNYLTFEALEDNCKFSINNNFQYSLDNGKTWIMLNKDEWTSNINKGQKILWKQYGYIHKNNDDIFLGIGTYKANAKFNVSGNIMSILFGDDFTDKMSFDIFDKYENIFAYLFKDNKYIYNAENLILPAIILTNFCYNGMFHGCTSLITAPKLPATVLGVGCYTEMFRECTSLTKAPSLLAKTLVNYCYNGMFRDCLSLSYIKCLSINNTNTMYNVHLWVDNIGINNITDQHTFIKHKDAQWVINENGIPEGWEIIEAEE